MQLGSETAKETNILSKAESKILVVEDSEASPIDSMKLQEEAKPARPKRTTLTRVSYSRLGHVVRAD